MALPFASSDLSWRPAHGPPPARRLRAAPWWRGALIVIGALVVAFLPSTLSLVAMVGVAAVLTLLRYPTLGLYALLFAVPFESVKYLNAGGLNVSVTNLVAFCIGAAWVAGCATRQQFTHGPTPWLRALLIYGLVMVISISQATSITLSLKELLKWGQMVAAYIVGVTLVRTRRELRRLLVVLFLAVLAESAIGLEQTILHAGPSSFARGGFLRAAGTFAQPNPFAGYLNMALPIAVALLAYRVFPRKPMWVVVAATGGGVLVSLSRGAELGTICALAVMGIMAVPRTRSLIGLAVVALVLIVAGGAAGVVPSTVTGSLAEQFGVANIDVANPTPVNWAAAERLAHMEAGLGMFVTHPFLGVGIGNYPAVYSGYQAPGPWGPALGHAHNYYINIAAEAGILGFGAFVFLLFSAFAIAVRAFRCATEPLDRAIALGATGVLVTIVVHSFFDDVFTHSMEVQWAIVMVAVSRVAAGFEEEKSLERVG